MSKNVLLVATVQSHICQFHRPLAEMLHMHGYEVHVAARNNLSEKNGLNLDFADRIYDVPFVRNPFSIDNIFAYKQLKHIIKEGDYYAVHCNTPVGGALTRIATNKLKTNSCVIYTAHGFHFYKGAPKKNWLIFYPVEKYLGRHTDKLITINSEDYEIANRKHISKHVYFLHGVGVYADRYTVPSYEERIEYKKKFGLENNKVILNVGELRKNKNQCMAIRAIKRLVPEYPEIKLLIAGNGPEEQNLKKYAMECEVQDHVVFLGYVTNLQDYQKATDMLVACSWREGLGLNILESLLSGNPVVATKNRGHVDTVENGNTGFLVDCNDDKSMASRIKEIIENRELYYDMSIKCREKGLLYSSEVVKKELEQIYFG